MDFFCLNTIGRDISDNKNTEINILKNVLVIRILVKENNINFRKERIEGNGNVRDSFGNYAIGLYGDGENDIVFSSN